MKHKFLRELELPLQLKNRLPSIMFESELANWMERRGHELESHCPPDYRYYPEPMMATIRQCHSNHDFCFESELVPEQHLQDEEYERFSFEGMGDFPARRLAVIAGELGWRLVPYARWVARHTGEESLAHYIEHHCRMWCDAADQVYFVLAKEKISRKNAMSQRALLAPILRRSEVLISASLRELELRQM
ncbi:MAG: hypothetical protein WC023_08095 [Rhodocyclaceae bacterium]